jgi:hypothetical protein
MVISSENRTSTMGMIMAVAAVVTVIALMPISADSQSFPRLPDGKPDFNGVWDRPAGGDVSRASNGGCANPKLTINGLKDCTSKVSGQLAYTDFGAEQAKEAKAKAFDYAAYCLPRGYTRAIQMTAYPIEIVQTPKRFAIFFEVDHPKLVPTDGTQHSDDDDPSWLGHSVGTYEGDTLVVDTNSFNGKAWIDTAGHLASDQLHIVQRFRNIDANHLEYQVTWEDPKMYKQPFSKTEVWVRMKPGVELLEFICEENNIAGNELQQRLGGKDGAK